MAIVANRRVALLPGWTFAPGQRVPEEVWDGLGKAKQKVLLAQRFFVPKHGKAAEQLPAPTFDAASSHPTPVPAVPPAPRKIVVWPEYEPPTDGNPSLRELAAMAPAVAEATQVADQPFVSFVCTDCGQTLPSKQALGGHRAKHTRERRKQLQEA